MPLKKLNLLLKSILISLLFLAPLASFAACESLDSDADQSIVLAIDISSSIDTNELTTQSQGYVYAFSSQPVVDKLLNCGCTELSIFFFGSRVHLMMDGLNITSEFELQTIRNFFSHYIGLERHHLPYLTLEPQGGGMTHISRVLRESISHLTQESRTKMRTVVVICIDIHSARNRYPIE